MHPVVFLNKYTSGMATGVCLTMCWWISRIRHLLQLCDHSGLLTVFHEQFTTLPLPPLLQFLSQVSTVWGRYSPLKFLQCDGAGWWLQAGMVAAHRVAMETSLLYLICARPLPTKLSWHQFPSSSIGDEFNWALIGSDLLCSSCELSFASWLINTHISTICTLDYPDHSAQSTWVQINEVWLYKKCLGLG